MDDNILISIIIPSLNAGHIIEKALKSIRNQSINQNQIEILVIDGGSVDNTIQIANKYNAVILENPQVVPESAKRIGIVNAKGKYIVRMDTDEEFTDPYQLEKRINLFKNYPQVKNILVSSFKTPVGYKGICDYINSFGDPFSYFVYHFDGSDMVHSLRKQLYEKHDQGYIFYFSKTDLLPIADSGTTMLDINFARTNFPDEIDKPEFVSSYLQKMVRETGCIGIVENDTVHHYATVNIKTYLKKLKFRVVNNIHNIEGSGYAAKALENKKLNCRKFLYPIYCLLFLWPLWDALILSIKKKNKFMMMHFVFVYYVLFQIIKQYILKLLKLKPKVIVFGK